MRFKHVLIVLIAFASYVLGAKAGEKRYREIVHAVTKHWDDPRVKKARAKANKMRTRAGKTARKKFS